MYMKITVMINLYILDPIDSKPHNDQRDGRSDGIRRNAFRIHHAVKGARNEGSDGCIVTMNLSSQH